jgi:endonuclease/exonuclease/phosphatase family metal-dependent hydrolase
VDSRSRSDDPFAKLASVVGDHRVHAKSIVTADGAYGQTLLSRFPFSGPPEIVDVSYREREPRRAIATGLLTPVGDVRVVATHLGLSIHERYAQAQALVSLVKPGRTVVLGDFNDWFWVRSVRRVLAQVCPNRTRLRTFPSHLPLLRLDRIYATSDSRIGKVWTDEAARAYSDHLPVIADIEISTDGR